MNSLPNLLTILRFVFLFPLLSLLLAFHNNARYSFALFALVLILFVTDFFDGYIARKFQCTSKFGKCFDPIVDKIAVLSFYIVFLSLHKISLAFFLIILIREILISGIREFLALEYGRSINVSQISKIKTALQMMSILALTLNIQYNYYQKAVSILLTITALITIITAIDYVVKLQNFRRPV